MAIISIQYTGAEHDYDENDERIPTPGNLKYESVEITYNGIADKKIFSSGNFIKDWFDAFKFYIRELNENESEPFLSRSSSCDHFFMDGAEYDPAYLHTKDDVHELKYVNYDDADWYLNQYEIHNDGLEFFVESGTKPTWQELKNICSI